MIFAAIACNLWRSGERGFFSSGGARFALPAPDPAHGTSWGRMVLSFISRSVFGLALATVPLSGGLACEALEADGTGTVVQIVDGDTVALAAGTEVRLVGIQAPKLPLGREGFVAWPLADAARTTLEDLVAGAEVSLRYGGARMDRHGRALAHLYLTEAGEGPVWIQEAMLEAGMARVYSFPDNRTCIAPMLAAEARARDAGRGIWSDPYYAVREADAPRALVDREGQYELVEGRVLNADRAGSRVYLNFGTYWKEDFTVVIEEHGQEMFAQAGLDPLALEGQMVRVRGWIDIYDGPRVQVTHPEQIEVLESR